MATVSTSRTGAMQCWRLCPALEEKDEEFLRSVADYLADLEALDPQQKRCLALFKAAELINALIQIKERRDAEDRVGPDLAKRSFQLVRAVIRNRCLPYAGSQSQCLRDPQLTAVIDEGCRLFHLGKSDKELYQQALALSAAQCIALQDELGPALDDYLQGCGFALPQSLIASVREAFIDAYRV
jgi:hypothetical protein